MLKDYLQSTGSRNVLSRIAEGVGLKKRGPAKYATTRHIQKGKPFGRYIRYEYTPPYNQFDGYRAVDVPSIDAEGREIAGMSTRRYMAHYAKRHAHSFLHATKGWRTYSNVPFALQREAARNAKAA